MKQIMNRNEKEELHGYQQWYYNNITLHIRGNMKNGDNIGYIEWHNYTEITSFYIR